MLPPVSPTCAPPADDTPATAPAPAPPATVGPGLIDGLDEGVVVCARAGVVRAANAAARALLPDLRVGEVVDVARCEVLARAVRGEGPGTGSFEAVVDRPRASATCAAAAARCSGRRRPRGPSPARATPPGSCATTPASTPAPTPCSPPRSVPPSSPRPAAALHGVLHLDRTARRVVALAVPRLATGAALGMRHDDQGTWAATELGGGRPRLGHTAASALTRVPRVAAALADEGGGVDVDPWLAEELATLPGLDAPGSGAPLRACPVPVTGVVEALVVLAGPRVADDDATDPEDDSLSSDVARAGAALAAAALHEEQADLGAVLQESLAAPRLPETDGVVWGAAYRPARETMRVGGDFYEVVGPRGPEGRSAFLLGDVCGKGIEAAVLSGRVRQSWHALRLLEDRPARLLPLLNTALLDAVATRDEGPRFATMVLGDARPQDDGTLALCLATGGHPPPLVLRADGNVETVPVAGMLVGGLREARFGEAEVLLGPGEPARRQRRGGRGARPRRLLRRGAPGRPLPACAGAPAAVVCEHLEQTVVEWLDGHDHDDVALLAIQAPA